MGRVIRHGVGQKGCQAELGRQGCGPGHQAGSRQKGCEQDHPARFGRQGCGQGCHVGLRMQGLEQDHTGFERQGWDR